MNTLVCARVWQVEAHRDGRVEGSAGSSFAEHVARCADCRAESARLDALRVRLREATTLPVDELRVARVRQKVLARVNTELTAQEPVGRTRQVAIRTAIAVVAAAFALGAIRGAPALLHGAGARSGPALSARAIGAARYSREHDRDREVLELTEGELEIRVRHSVARHPLVVRVPDGTIRDLGTTFRVSVRAGRTVAIRVFDGMIAFDRPGSPTVVVAAGGSWHADDRASTPTPDRAPTPNAPDDTTFERDHVRTREAESGEDAAYLRTIELVRGEDRAAARAAAQQYLRRFPTGFRRVEIEHLVETLETEATPESP